MGLPVLIVDDDRVLCGILARQLAVLGYEPSKAENGDEAVELARHRAYAAIFIDFEMPNENGVQVMQRLETLQPNATMVMTSGWNQPTVIDALAGANLHRCRVLAKPWALEQVIAILNDAAASYAADELSPAVQQA